MGNYFCRRLTYLLSVTNKRPNFESLNNKTMRYCLALDLKDDPESIENYKKYHQKENFRPEITASIKRAGIIDMQIFLTGNRLFMIM